MADWVWTDLKSSLLLLRRCKSTVIVKGVTKRHVPKVG